MKSSSLSLPHADQVEEASQLNSFIIFTLHQFLETTRILIVPLPTQKTVYHCQLLDVILVCTHHPQIHIKISCNVVFCSSPTSFPKCSTLEMQASYISKLLLESGAHTAITTLVPKRIAVHLSSNFHDLSLVQNRARVWSSLKSFSFCGRIVKRPLAIDAH